ncbi:MAG TPA: hypothetical protein VHC22_00720 [Pirellulales bacterium]|nr:hypothetical protein [Pirellulales bacterium]
MPLELPDLSGPLQQIEICGAFSIGPTEENAWLTASEFRAVSNYSRNGQTVFARVLLGKFDSEVAHVHLSFAAERCFAQRRAPTVSASLDELCAAVERLYGLDGSCFFDGRLTIPNDELPEWGIIETLKEIETTSGNATLELTGSRFRVRGHEFANKLVWHESPDGGAIVVEIEGRVRTIALDETIVSRVSSIVLEAGRQLATENTEVPNDA